MKEERNIITGSEPANPTTTRVQLMWDSEQLYNEPKMVTVMEGGLTIRQQFAMAAMQGFLASYAGMDGNIPREGVAKSSVEFADALIAELNKEVKP